MLQDTGVDASPVSSYTANSAALGTAVGLIRGYKVSSIPPDFGRSAVGARGGPEFGVQQVPARAVASAHLGTGRSGRQNGAGVLASKYAFPDRVWT